MLYFRAAMLLVPAIAVFSYTSVQRIWHAHGLTLSKKRRAGMMDHDYKRNGTATLFAPLNMLEWIFGLACVMVTFGAFAAAPPVPRVQSTDTAVELVDVATLPPGEDGPAYVSYLFHAGDGSGRLFVADMRGRIYVMKGGKLLARPFLNLETARPGNFGHTAHSNGETGLLTFAFHPDFAHKGMPGYRHVYTLHSENEHAVTAAGITVFPGPKPDPHHFNVLSEWSVDPADADRIDPKSRRELFRLAAPDDDHSGGQLGFNPNAKPGSPDYGLLYIAVGDGGNTVWDNGQVEKYHLAQNMMSAFGKILRINPLRSGASAYSVPATNPFVRERNTLPEIWASGLRNPQRFSWDRGGAQMMLIADIGQATVEEINLGRPGANYGWGIYEGDFLVDHHDEKNLTALPALPKGFAFPVAIFGHAGDTAVAGGFVYRGKTVPELAGKYVFGDIASGALFYADAASMEAGIRTPVFGLRLFYHGAETTLAKVIKSSRADLHFGLGEDGEIYLLTKTDGAVRKLARHSR